MLTYTPRIDAVAGGGVPNRSLLMLLRDSCRAFYVYEDLRHMSDAQLSRRGLRRDQVARRVFEILHES